MEPEGLALGEAAALGAAGEALGTEVAVGATVAGTLDVLAVTEGLGIGISAIVARLVGEVEAVAIEEAAMEVASDALLEGDAEALAPVTCSTVWPPTNNTTSRPTVAMNDAIKPASQLARGAKKPATMAGRSGG